jgi:hypothetical protein
MLLHKFRLLVLLLVATFSLSCENDSEEGCETETVCFGQGNCIERPIEGTCFN